MFTAVLPEDRPMTSRLVAVSAALLLSFANVPAYSQTRSATDPGTKSGNQVQPQGETGPINTTSGGAPASSPQGDTPGGMQAAPQGSGKSVKTETSGEPVADHKK
jgi:hypothetical protein